MLIGADGHLKLTDFGLSEVALKRDLQEDDLISPNLTPKSSVEENEEDHDSPEKSEIKQEISQSTKKFEPDISKIQQDSETQQTKIIEHVTPNSSHSRML